MKSLCINFGSYEFVLINRVIDLDPVVQRVDNFIQRIEPHPVDKLARCPIKIKDASILSAG